MALANIVVNDATPVTPLPHTFVGIQDGADARFVNSAGAQTLLGQELLNVSIKRASSATQAHTARVTLWDPTEVVDSGTGLYSVDHGNSCDMRFNFSPKATLQERKNIVEMAFNAIDELRDTIADVVPLL